MTQSLMERLVLKAKGDRTKRTVSTCVESILSHHLQKSSFPEKAYRKYIHDDFKSLKGNTKSRGQKE